MVLMGFSPISLNNGTTSSYNRLKRNCKIEIRCCGTVCFLLKKIVQVLSLVIPLYN